MSYNYTNLVFEGGGVKGIAYAGALEVLSERGILQNVKKAAGTSAGAITATLVCLGYSAAKIKEAIFALDFSKFEDGWDPLRLPIEYGLYKGDAFLKWIQEMITGKAKAGANATFEDLHNQGLPDLYVYSTDLNIFDIKQFSYTDTPNVIVAEAVRASMSIPLFFKAWKFTNSIPDDHIYVDGGVVLNYPLTVFDTVTQPDEPQTLGLYLYDYDNCKKPSSLNYDELITYCKTLFETLLESQNIDFSVDPSTEARTVKINDFGILATDFRITQEQKTELYESGIKYTTDYLDKQAR
jgi:NTE family protein